MYTLSIVRDPDPENPRNQDNTGHMVCFHSKYDLGDQFSLAPSEFTGWEELKQALITRFDASTILPLYLLDHSGLTLRTTPFSDPWDSGQVGFIYATTADAKECLEAEVEEYNLYLNEEVYGYEIENEAHEVVESCYGFYGEKAAMETGKLDLEHLEKRHD